MGDIVVPTNVEISDPALRAKYIKGRSGGGDRREPDPNSPFAKLAALLGGAACVDTATMRLLQYSPTRVHPKP